MESLNLPLYPTLESTPKFNTRTENIMYVKPSIQSPNPQILTENILNSILPQQTEETKITRIRSILGETAKTLSDEQIRCIATEFQFLIDTWLDEYEKEVFNGMSLKEILNEK